MSKRLSFILVLFFTLTMFIGCDSNEELFSTKTEAIKYFIDSNHVLGDIILIQTIKEEHLLIAASREDIFFIGELKNSNEKYYTISLTAHSSFKNAEPKGSIGFTSSLGNDYTVIFDSEQNQDSIFISNKFNASIYEGHIDISETPDKKSAISSAETIKFNP